MIFPESDCVHQSLAGQITFLGRTFMSTLQVSVPRTMPANPMQRILLKQIRTRDDLDQLYLVLRGSVAQGNEVWAEVWESCDEAQAPQRFALPQENQKTEMQKVQTDHHQE